MWISRPTPDLTIPVPCKALLNNQEQRLHKYMQLVGRRAALWHGDTPQGERKRLLAEPPDLMLTTRESLEVMLVSSKIDHHRFFKNIKVVAGNSRRVVF